MSRDSPMKRHTTPPVHRRRQNIDLNGDRLTLRQRVYVILEEGQTQGVLSRIVETLTIILIITNVVMVTLETVPSAYTPNKVLFANFETFTVFFFAIEYVIRLWACVEDPRVGTVRPFIGRIRFAARPMAAVDLLSFAPYFVTMLTGGALDLRALRILRLLRLLKLARYSQALPAMLAVLYAERRALIGSFILLMCAVCLSAEVMHLIEGGGQPNDFGTLPSAMYWSITTLSTVGYGDVIPHTYLGKLVSGFTMIIGLLLFAMPIGIISAGFVNGLNRREFSITWSMVKRQPLFEDFDVEAVSYIVELMGARVIQEHVRISTSGQPGENFYLVISGRARAEDDIGTWEMEAGDMIGDEMITGDTGYTKTITARSEMRLMVIPAEDMRRLCRKYPLLEKRINNDLTR
jgi:voltage-gated potassium channel